MLRTRPAIWAAAVLTSGVAIVVGNRLSVLLVPAAAVGVLVPVVGVIALYDAVSVGRRGNALRSRSTRGDLKALAAAVCIASLVAGAVFLVVMIADQLFESLGSRPPVSGGAADV